MDAGTIETGGYLGQAGRLSYGLGRTPEFGSRSDFETEEAAGGIGAGVDLLRDEAAGPPGNLKERMALFERELIREALETYAWNKSRTARHLGLTRQGLHRKVRRFGIVKQDGAV